jgi:hypothetical protein
MVSQNIQYQWSNYMKEPLADKFNRWRNTIEAAETPFSKLAIFILPILAPIVPASFTGLHIYKMLIEIFSFNTVLSVVLSLIVAVVLELLGYVGAISFIQSVYDWLHSDGKENYLVPVVINFSAYVFYLIIMFLVNVLLDQYFQTPSIVNKIIGILSFITVPTGLLAANHLNQKSYEEHKEKVRQEKREDRLKGKALDNGINIFAQMPQVHQQVVDSVSVPQRADWRTLSMAEKKAFKTMPYTEIMSKYKVGESTAFLWIKNSKSL